MVINHLFNGMILQVLEDEILSFLGLPESLFSQAHPRWWVEKDSR